LLIALSVIACQSTVRYTSNRAYSDIYVDDGSSDGSVIAARMGRVIAGYLHVPYEKGGRDKSGIDCSGLVSAIYDEYNGTRLPPNSRKLYNNLKSVEYRNIKYGDLLFFSLNGSKISHVGIYVGNGKFVHASESKGVIISSLKESYFKNSFEGVRRVFW